MPAVQRHCPVLGFPTRWTRAGAEPLPLLCAQHLAGMESEGIWGLLGLALTMGLVLTGQKAGEEKAVDKEMACAKALRWVTYSLLSVTGRKQGQK